MPKMRLKLDRLQTSCLASGVAVHPKAEGSLVGRQCTRTQWIWVNSMVLPRTLEKLLNCSMPWFPTAEEHQQEQEGSWSHFTHVSPKIVPTISDRASLSPSNGLTALPHSCPSWQSSPFAASLPDLARRTLRPSCRTDKKPGHGSNKATGAVISLNLGSNFLLAKSIRTHTVNYMRLFTSRIIK